MALVIAEIGVNHNGDMDLAIELMAVAEECGADAVKFQLFDPAKLEHPGPRREMLKDLALTCKQMADLKRRCRVRFICTPFDPDSARFLIDDLNVTVKIGSADLDNVVLMNAVRGADVILSTGMATMGMVADAVVIVGTASLLHCVSSYPTPVDQVNLLAMNELKVFGLPVGLSDHTKSVVVPAVAVGMGAAIIEKHITLDCGMEGPDHCASMEPYEFAEMVRNVREAERALGDGIKKPSPCEARVIKIARERAEWRSRTG
jgi:sialic acid synthase SpsE